MLQLFFEQMKNSKPEIFQDQSEESCREISAGAASGLCKTLLFENLLGKEGVDYKSGGRMYFDNDVVAQSFERKGKEGTLYYDISVFNISRKETPQQDPYWDYVDPYSFLEEPVCKDLSETQKEAIKDSFSHFQGSKIHPEVAHTLLSNFAAQGLCTLAFAEGMSERFDKAFSAILAAKAIFSNPKLDKEFGDAIQKLGLAISSNDKVDAKSSVYQALTHLNNLMQLEIGNDKPKK